MVARKEVVVGDMFGSLIIKSIWPEKRNAGGRGWKCLVECACGYSQEMWKHNLTSGHTVRCRECSKLVVGAARTTHGHTRGRTTGGDISPTYISWSKMWERVRHPERNPHYVGVVVCERWESFENFLADMGERLDGTSIDRINTHGNYEPTNCRWATPKEQSQNRRAWKHTPEGLAKITLNLIKGN